MALTPQARETFTRLFGVEPQPHPTDPELFDILQNGIFDEAFSTGVLTAVERELISLVRGRGGGVGPKYGWTDVARFCAAGTPAVNLGPGDPMQCHTDDEHCPVAQIEAVAHVLRAWLA